MDLTNSNNWFTVQQGTVKANVTGTGGEGQGAIIFFDPIPPLQFSVGSPVISVRVFINDLAPTARWYKAGWLSAYLDLPIGRKRVFNSQLYLDYGSIFHIPWYGVLPYIVRIVFPKYFDHANYMISQFNINKTDFVVTDPGLQNYLEGQEITLSNVTFQQQLLNGNYLYEFTEQVKFSKYQVRYYTGLNEAVLAQQPIFNTEPGLLKVRLYTKVPLVNQISVKVGV